MSAAAGCTNTRPPLATMHRAGRADTTLPKNSTAFRPWPVHSHTAKKGKPMAKVTALRLAKPADAQRPWHVRFVPIVLQHYFRP
jgi:hypothetical protein